MYFSRQLTVTVSSATYQQNYMDGWMVLLKTVAVRSAMNTCGLYRQVLRICMSVMMLPLEPSVHLYLYGSIKPSACHYLNRLNLITRRCNCAKSADHGDVKGAR